MSVTGRKRAVTRAVKEVAHYLGNTPAVCRSSYIDPRVIDRFNEGRTIRPALESLGVAATGDPGTTLITQGAIEAAVLHGRRTTVHCPSCFRPVSYPSYRCPGCRARCACTTPQSPSCMASGRRCPSRR